MGQKSASSAATVTRWVTVCVAGLVALAGCSARPYAERKGSAGMNDAVPAAASPQASASLSTEAARAAEAARPNGKASCKMLSLSKVRAILDGDLGAGAKDLRKNEAARAQLDGCIYAAKDGTRLSYLVWEMATTDYKEAVHAALPPKELGARVFDPRIGKVSAGAVMVTGPMVVAQVNVVSRGRLVQVTVTTKGGDDATRAATAAARSLVGAGA